MTFSSNLHVDVMPSSTHGIHDKVFTKRTIINERTKKKASSNNNAVDMPGL
jgi:hypothetical protein